MALLQVMLRPTAHLLRDLAWERDARLVGHLPTRGWNAISPIHSAVMRTVRYTEKIGLGRLRFLVCFRSWRKQEAL